jgi:hypothetical protein
MPAVGGGLTALLAGFGQGALLGAYRWWAPLVVGGAWLSTHYFLRRGAIWRGRHSADVIEKQRRADYAYRLTVQAPAAKEVRLFGLGVWVVDGFARLRRELLDLSWAERRLGFRPTQSAMLCIGAANVLFFWSLAHDANFGRVSLAELVVYAQAALGTSALAFSDLDWWLRTSAQPVPLVLDLVARMQKIGGLPSGTRPAAGLPAREIRFEGIGFAYPHAERAVLEGWARTARARPRSPSSSAGSTSRPRDASRSTASTCASSTSTPGAHASPPCSRTSCATSCRCATMSRREARFATTTCAPRSRSRARASSPTSTPYSRASTPAAPISRADSGSAWRWRARSTPCASVPGA